MTAAPTGVAASGASTATTTATRQQQSTDVSFTPLYGCYDDSGRGAGPVSSLLEVGGVTILLDCGWDINFDEQLLAPLAAVVSRIDLVLISHPDLEHMGGLPYAVGKLGLSAPIFATLPTTKMGQMAVYDAHQMRVAEAGAAFKVCITYIAC
jgi:cleavage and polyadenylation specificity factor subunit 2